MNILLISPQPFHEKRGTPLAVALLAKALGELGHTVDLVTYHLGSEWPLTNVRHLRARHVPFITSVGKGLSAKKIFLDIFIFLKALELLRHNTYDCIHGVEEGAFMGVLLKWKTGIPLVYDMDSSIPEQLQDSSSKLWSSAPFIFLATRLERWAARNADLVIAVCKALRDKVASFNPTVPIEIIEDIPVSEKSTANTAEDVKKLRQELAVFDNPCVVYTGTFEEYQGIGLLLMSIPLVLANVPNALFILVGGLPEQVREVGSRAEQMGIFQHLRILGRRPLEEMPAFMSLAQVLVSPRTLGINTPMKIYSYMQAGRAIVATRLLTHTQVLDDSTALLADAEPGAFAEAITTLLNDSLYAEQVGSAAFDYVEKNFTYATFKQKLQRAYSRLTPC